MSPCLFNLYAENIIQNAGLDEAQARRSINNLRYADDTPLMTEGKEELKSLLMKVKGEHEKADLKLNIQKTKIMVSGPITSWEIMGKQWKQCRTLFFWAPKSLQMVIETESEVAQSCSILCDPVDCSLLGFSIHGIFQARELEWIAISFSRASFQSRDRTQVSHATDRRFTV